MMSLLRRFFVQDESGQGTVEYIVLIALVVVALVGLILAFSGKLQGLWTNATNALPS